MNLNRDFLKTLGGILIIGAIVVATFLIGNQQRQDQIRSEQAAKEKSEKNTTKTAANTKTQTNKQTGGKGGGSIPQTGGELWMLAIPALGAGVAQYKIARRRQRFF